MNIRKAAMGDLEAVASMELLCFPEAEAATKESFEKRIAVFGDCFWLLENEEGNLIGMINGMVSDEPLLRDEMFEDANLHNPEGAWQMIFGVETIPEYRNHGYAAIMETVIAECRSLGRKGLVLTCKDRLVHYYEKFGFVNEGKSASVHGGAVWYDMRLTF